MRPMADAGNHVRNVWQCHVRDGGVRNQAGWVAQTNMRTNHRRLLQGIDHGGGHILRCCGATKIRGTGAAATDHAFNGADDPIVGG